MVNYNWVKTIDDREKANISLLRLVVLPASTELK